MNIKLSYCILYVYYREFMSGQISQSHSRRVRTTSCPLRWSDGIVSSTVSPHWLREGNLATSGVCKTARTAWNKTEVKKRLFHANTDDNVSFQFYFMYIEPLRVTVLCQPEMCVGCIKCTVEIYQATSNWWANASSVSLPLYLLLLYVLMWFLWQINSLVSWLCSNGCATSEDMLWKLEALQTFVFDLHWPDEVFAEHINQRLKTLSTEMIEAAADRFSPPVVFVRLYTWTSDRSSIRRRCSFSNNFDASAALPQLLRAILELMSDSSVVEW